MTQKTCAQEIEEIHEFIDNQYRDALNHFDTNYSDPYINEDDEEFESIIDYIEYNILGFDYVQAEEDRNNISLSSTGFWRFQISWGGPQQEYRFYMNDPLQDEPTAIKFWHLNWGDGACDDDVRGIGQRLWDYLEEQREYIIDH